MVYAIDTVILLVSLDQRSVWYPGSHVRDCQRPAAAVAGAGPASDRAAGQEAMTTSVRWSFAIRSPAYDISNHSNGSTVNQEARCA
jgi:hypothetical protein